MPDITIRDRWTGSVIYSGDHDTIAGAVAACTSKGVSLSRANLSGTELIGANLIGADLSSADLISTNLSDADLVGANLTDANLTDAKLTDANLIGADLVGANLTDANLTDANLSRADLTEATLSSADLTAADLTSARLSGANLSYANLTDANLTDANLTSAILTSADLLGANLIGATIDLLTASKLSIVPEIGEFIGFKQVASGRVIGVRIPADARRSNSTTRKCRAEYVIPIDMGDATEEVSKYDPSFVYRLNEPARCNKWEENRWIECGGGIHFFLTRAEAEAY